MDWLPDGWSSMTTIGRTPAPRAAITSAGVRPRGSGNPASSSSLVGIVIPLGSVMVLSWNIIPHRRHWWGCAWRPLRRYPSPPTARRAAAWDQSPPEVRDRTLESLVDRSPPPGLSRRSPIRKGDRERRLLPPRRATPHLPLPDAGHRDGLRPSQTQGCCLLYTSDAADDLLCVDLGGRRIIK